MPRSSSCSEQLDRIAEGIPSPEQRSADEGVAGRRGRPLVAESLHRCGKKRTLGLAGALLLLTLAGCRPPPERLTPATDREEARGDEAPIRPRAPVAAPTPIVLGDHPLCEASAALVAPWDESTILVADNEERRALFAFTERNGQLVDQRELSLPRGGPRDMEALARVGEQVLVVGSFSRNSSCKARRNRARLMLVEGEAGSADLREVRSIDGRNVLTSLGTEEECLSTLFTRPELQGARQVCAALAAAEREADDDGRCETLNIEGAVGVPGSPDRVWLGLRSPLVDGRAVLLRLVEGLDEARFDAVAFVDLDGRSIRGLERVGNEVWGIAGPTSDSDRGFRLFSLSADRLVPGASLDDVAERGSLPSYSEGLVSVGDKLHVLIDGDQGKGPKCEVPAKQVAWPVR